MIRFEVHVGIGVGIILVGMLVLFYLIELICQDLM